ncbi:phage tail assembly chaperone [uncultured Ramlibacter sp.]|uniref:phage tail assembly chaperone n=1 Tax=uncultured Ramlibacter sp. TaxID=260755 RepID=UPI0026294BBB|nr:phage tail assembly chaperone [uncultured Ramlibacter sp.]
MTKIVLGKRPETFKPFPVKFEMPDGTEGVIQATFNYCTRTEFGAMLNKIFAVASKDAQVEGALDYAKIFAETADKNAEHLLAALHAWDLDAELSLKSLQELCDTIPAASAALMGAFSVAAQQGRLGN